MKTYHSCKKQWHLSIQKQSCSLFLYESWERVIHRQTLWTKRISDFKTNCGLTETMALWTIVEIFSGYSPFAIIRLCYCFWTCEFLLQYFNFLVIRYYHKYQKLWFQDNILLQHVKTNKYWRCKLFYNIWSVYDIKYFGSFFNQVSRLVETTFVHLQRNLIMYTTSNTTATAQNRQKQQMVQLQTLFFFIFTWVLVQQ